MARRATHEGDKTGGKKRDQKSEEKRVALASDVTGCFGAKLRQAHWHKIAYATCFALGQAE